MLSQIPAVTRLARVPDPGRVWGERAGAFGVKTPDAILSLDDITCE